MADVFNGMCACTCINILNGTYMYMYDIKWCTG